MRQEEPIERLVLTRGWIISICAAAAATAVASMISAPIGAWACLHVRDLSLAISGSILIALGLRHVRANGISFRTVAYPVGGMLLFAILTGLLVAAETVLRSSIAALGADAPAELTAQLDAIQNGRLFWLVTAGIAGLAGVLTPVRVPAA